MLHFPFRLFPYLIGIPILFKHDWFQVFSLDYFCLNLNRLFFCLLANLLMLVNSVWCKFSSTFSARNQLRIWIFILLIFIKIVLNFLWLQNRIFLFRSVMLSYHWTYFARLLMWNQWFLIKLSATNLACNKSLVHKCVKRASIVFHNILFGNILFRD